jgi:hypothetical protein
MNNYPSREDFDAFFTDPEGEKDFISRRRERQEMMAQLRAERAQWMRDDTDYHANDVDD